MELTEGEQARNVRPRLIKRSRNCLHIKFSPVGSFTKWPILTEPLLDKRVIHHKWGGVP